MGAGANGTVQAPALQPDGKWLRGWSVCVLQWPEGASVTVGGMQNGNGAAAKFYGLQAICYNPVRLVWYLADGTYNSIRQLDVNGTVMMTDNGNHALGSFAWRGYHTDKQ